MLWLLYAIVLCLTSQELYADSSIVEGTPLKKTAAQLHCSGALTVVGRCPLSNGYCYTVFVQDGYAYYGDGGIFTIADVSDPSNPRVISTYALPYSVVSGIRVSEGFAFVANQLGGFVVLDIRNPEETAEVWTYPGAAMAVIIADTVAYVADYYAGLKIFDIRDPSAPVLLGTYFDEKISAIDVAVSGDYAYVGYCLYGMIVLDVHEPGNPAKVGHFETGGSAVGIAVSGGYAYVSDRDYGLYVLDIRKPYDPVECGFFSTVIASNITIQDAYGYLSNGGFGLRILDISNPGNPVEKGFFEAPNFIQDTFVEGEYLYIADWKDGILIVRFDDTPALVGEDESVLSDVSGIRLFRNYPNPFNTSTTISYTIDAPCRVTVSVLTVLGQRIRLLADEIQSSGLHSVYWDGTDSGNRVVTSGIYFFRVQAGAFDESRKMLFSK